MTKLSPALTNHYEQESVDQLIKALMDIPAVSKTINLGEMDLLFKEEKERGSRIRHFRFSSANGHIESFLEDIDDCISNIRRSDICNSSHGYQFPSSHTTKEYHKAFEIDDEDHFVNETTDTVALAADKLIDRLCVNHNKFDNICITGKVGSGKSTFLAYFLNLLSTRAVDRRALISYSLISYEDVRSNFRSTTEKDDWKICFETRALNQAIYYSLKKLHTLPDFPRNLLAWVGARELLNVFPESVIATIRSVAGAISEARFEKIWDKIFVGAHLRDDVKRALLQFLIKEFDLKIVIVFDGFDAFFLDKIINKNYAEIVQYFSKTIFLGENVLGLEKNSYACLLSLRDCTYSRLMKMLHTEDKASIERWRICPPGVKKSLHRGIRKYFDDLTEREIKGATKSNIQMIASRNAALKDSFIKAFDNVHEEIKREFAADDDDIVVIFNQDYRRMKSYYILVLRQLVSDVISAKGTLDKEEFFFEITSASIGSIPKKHDLLELHILRDSKVFFNYFSSIDYDELGIHAEVNTCRGLVDNVYGYSFQQFTHLSDIPVSLVKIRILQYLISKDRHAEAKEVAAELENFGYIAQEHVMQDILNMMGEVGFVKNRYSEEKRVIVYTYTGLGKYVVQNLLRNNRYIEHVLQKTLIPTKLTGYMYPLCKYCEDNLPTWVYFSTINLYVFFTYISTLESRELAWWPDTESARYIETYSLRESFQSMMQSLENVFRSRLGQGFIDTKSLTAKLQSIKTCIEGSLR